MHQMSNTESVIGLAGEAGQGIARDESRRASPDKPNAGTRSLLEAALAEENVAAAWKQVRRNNGSAGVDGRSVQETEVYLKSAWHIITWQIRTNRYRPCGLRMVPIPKQSGGVRMLGIPTVTDRLIQQALLQVLQPLFDPTFSDHSYGFRPGRSAQQAVTRAFGYVEEGYKTVVDIDLASFFDRVNHDILMDRLAKRIDDKPTLKLIRRYLRAGALLNGAMVEREEGTPQGGPLSPLLANVLLDEVDKTLERRGHRFVRYADDLNVYVRSPKAGERVFRGLLRHFGRLSLTVNLEKSAVAPVARRKFLGYSIWWRRGPHLRVAGAALKRFRNRVRQITRRGCGLAQAIKGLAVYLPGWKRYFQLASTPNVFRELDGWIRHRLRAVILKQWRRGVTAYRELRRLGASERLAAAIASNLKRWWHNSALALNYVMPPAYFDRLGVPRLS